MSAGGGGLAMSAGANSHAMAAGPGAHRLPPQGQSIPGSSAPPVTNAALGADLVDKNQNLSLKQARNLSHLPIAMQRDFSLPGWICMQVSLMSPCFRPRTKLRLGGLRLWLEK